MTKIANSALKSIGLTPWQLIAGLMFCTCWFTTLRPMPQAVADLTATVAGLSVKVEIHAVLLQQMGDMAQEMSLVRQKLAELDGRMQSAAAYNNNRRDLEK